MNNVKDIGGGIIVSRPAYSGGIMKNINNLRDVPTTNDVIAAGQFDFFQNKPKVKGAQAPAKAISNAKIR
jgi:hypothetical protein